MPSASPQDLSLLSVLEGAEVRGRGNSIRQLSGSLREVSHFEALPLKKVLACVVLECGSVASVQPLPSYVRMLPV